MYYSNARWYDAEAGRFISEDPVQDGSNWYVYVRNNPLVFVDPTGLAPILEKGETSGKTEGAEGSPESADDVSETGEESTAESETATEYAQIPQIPRCDYTGYAFIHPFTYLNNVGIGILNDAINIVNPVIVAPQAIYDQGLGTVVTHDIETVKNAAQSVGETAGNVLGGAGKGIVNGYQYVTSNSPTEMAMDLAQTITEDIPEAFGQSLKRTISNKWSDPEYWEGVGKFAVGLVVGNQIAKAAASGSKGATLAKEAAGWGDEAAGAAKGEMHHIASNKSIKSGFTKQYQQIFNKAGMKLNDAANKVFLEGHKGAHTIKYKQYVLDTLKGATRGLSGKTYKNALSNALDNLGQQLLQNPKLPYKGGL